MQFEQFSKNSIVRIIERVAGPLKAENARSLTVDHEVAERGIELTWVYDREAARKRR